MQTNMQTKPQDSRVRDLSKTRDAHTLSKHTHTRTRTHTHTHTGRRASARVRHPQHDSIRRGSREYFSPCAPRGRASRAAAAPRKVEVGRVEPEPARQVLGRDVVLPCVCFRVTRHISCARTACAPAAAYALRYLVYGFTTLNYFIHSVESLERNLQRQPEGRKASESKHESAVSIVPLRSLDRQNS